MPLNELKHRLQKSYSKGGTQSPTFSLSNFGNRFGSVSNRITPQLLSSFLVAPFALAIEREMIDRKRDELDQCCTKTQIPLEVHLSPSQKVEVANFLSKPYCLIKEKRFRKKLG